MQKEYAITSPKELAELERIKKRQIADAARTQKLEVRIMERKLGTISRIAAAIASGGGIELILAPFKSGPRWHRLIRELRKNLEDLPPQYRNYKEEWFDPEDEDTQACIVERERHKAA